MATSDCNFLSVIKDIKLDIYPNIQRAEKEIDAQYDAILTMYHDIVSIQKDIDRKYAHMLIIEQKLNNFNSGYMMCGLADDQCSGDDTPTGSC
jgi:asparagine synthetase A